MGPKRPKNLQATLKGSRYNKLRAINRTATSHPHLHLPRQGGGKEWDCHVVHNTPFQRFGKGTRLAMTKYVGLVRQAARSANQLAE